MYLNILNLSECLMGKEATLIFHNYYNKLLHSLGEETKQRADYEIFEDLNYFAQIEVNAIPKKLKDLKFEGINSYIKKVGNERITVFCRVWTSNQKSSRMPDIQIDEQVVRLVLDPYPKLTFVKVNKFVSAKTKSEFLAAIVTGEIPK